MTGLGACGWGGAYGGGGWGGGAMFGIWHLLWWGLLIVGIVALYLSLGRIVKTGVETLGPKFTGAPVKVESVSFSAFSGRRAFSSFSGFSPRARSAPLARFRGGLAATGELAPEDMARIDAAEGARLAAEAESYRKDLKAAVERSIALAPVALVRDGFSGEVLVPEECQTLGAYGAALCARAN